MVLSDGTKALLRAKAATLILLRENGWAEFTEAVILSTEEPAIVRDAFASLAKDHPACTLHARSHRSSILTEAGTEPSQFVPGAFIEDSALWEELAGDAEKLYHKLRIAYRKDLEKQGG